MPASTDRAPESVEALSASPAQVTIVAHDIGAVGGMERVLGELVLGLHSRGHQVTVIARTCELPTRDGVTFHRVPGPSRPVLLAYPWFMLVGSAMVSRWRRGILQSTGAIVFNRPDVIAVHYCHQVGPANPSRASLLFRAHSALVGRLLRAAERVYFRANRSATFVGVSDGVAAELREHYPELRGRVVTIHNGVDTDAFAPGVRTADARTLRARLGISDGRLVAVFVGSEWERKGLEPLIRALANAPAWELVVAGGGDRARYMQLARSLGVERVVHWLGVTADVQLLYAAGDAFVLPSSYETFSLVTFEAAASGLAVLATPVSGVRELIEDGHNGFLIDRSEQTIAERLNRLAGDASLRTRLGRAARESALAFSWDEMVKEHEQLYARLAAMQAV